MPLYEYYCNTCTTSFEVLRSMSAAESLETCPDGHTGAERALSVFATVAGDAAGTSPEDAGCGHCGAPEPGSCAFN